MWIVDKVAVVDAEVEASGIEAHVEVSVLSEVMNADDRGSETWQVFLFKFT